MCHGFEVTLLAFTSWLPPRQLGGKGGSVKQIFENFSPRFWKRCKGDARDFRYVNKMADDCSLSKQQPHAGAFTGHYPSGTVRPIYIGRAHRYPPNTPFYIFIQQIYVLNILNMLHILRFFSSSKCRLFHNATFFWFLYYSHFIYRVC